VEQAGTDHGPGACRHRPRAGDASDAEARARLVAADLAYYRGGRRVFAKLLGEMRTAFRGAADVERLRAAAGAALPEVPVAVLSGDPEAAVGTTAGLIPDLVATHRRLADEVPGARYELVAGSGHFVQLDRPEVVVRAIREVLERV
jgi:pimeloyl-ACP methyl ester carboxylesterase